MSNQYQRTSSVSNTNFGTRYRGCQPKPRTRATREEARENVLDALRTVLTPDKEPSGDAVRQ